MLCLRCLTGLPLALALIGGKETALALIGPLTFDALATELSGALFSFINEAIGLLASTRAGLIVKVREVLSWMPPVAACRLVSRAGQPREVT